MLITINMKTAEICDYLDPERYKKISFEKFISMSDKELKKQNIFAVEIPDDIYYGCDLKRYIYARLNKIYWNDIFYKESRKLLNKVRKECKFLSDEHKMLLIKEV